MRILAQLFSVKDPGAFFLILIPKLKMTLITKRLVISKWAYYYWSVLQGGILGVAGRFPPAYMAAVFSGQAVGGIFASGTNVVVLAMGASPSDVRSLRFCIFLYLKYFASKFLGILVIWAHVNSNFESYEIFRWKNYKVNIYFIKNKFLIM